MAYEMLQNWPDSDRERREGFDSLSRRAPTVSNRFSREELIESFKEFVNRQAFENRILKNVKSTLDNLLDTLNLTHLSSTVDSFGIWRSELTAQILARSVGGLVCFSSLYIVFALTRFLWKTKIPLFMTPVLAVAPAALLCSLIVFCIIFSKYLCYPLLCSVIMDPSYLRSGSTFRSFQLLSQELRYQRTLYRLCLSDRDFTDQDYELLLELDNEPGIQAMRRFIEGVTPERIESLPTYRYRCKNSFSYSENASHDHDNTLSKQWKKKNSYRTTLYYFWTAIYNILQRFLSFITLSKRTSYDFALKEEEEQSLVKRRRNSHCSNLSVFRRRSNNSFSSLQSFGSAESCPICLEEFVQEDLIRVLPCKHEFHGDCIFAWLIERGRCPVCKYSITE